MIEVTRGSEISAQFSILSLKHDSRLHIVAADTETFATFYVIIIVIRLYRG